MNPQTSSTTISHNHCLLNGSMKHLLCITPPNQHSMLPQTNPTNPALILALTTRSIYAPIHQALDRLSTILLQIIETTTQVQVPVQLASPMNNSAPQITNLAMLLPQSTQQFGTSHPTIQPNKYHPGHPPNLLATILPAEPRANGPSTWHPYSIIT